jgi:hypothetical protein
MKKKNKPVITVAGVRVISPLSPRYAGWCAGCGKTVELVKIDEAALIAGTGVEPIIERAARRKIHLGIRPEALLFCVDSLLQKETAAPAARLRGN